MIEYDNLKAAADVADVSPHLDTEAWCEAEKIDYLGMMTFAAEHSGEIIGSGKIPFQGSPLVAQALLAMGLIMGIRYANILNQGQGES